MALTKLGLAGAGELRTNVLDVLNEVVGNDVDCLNYQSVMVQVAGTWTGTITFEVSNDATNWVIKSLVPSNGGGPASTTTAVGVWSGDVGARYFRARLSTLGTGAATVIVMFSSVSQSNNIGTQTIAGSVSVAGSGSTSAAKLEDVAAASGDMGIFVLGVRAPATPIAPTSAAGDYGSIMVDDEGKLLSAGTGNSTQTRQARVDYTTTSDVALLATAGATLRNYITTITIENTGAAAARFLLRDVTTTVWSVTVPAGSTHTITFDQPLRPAAVNTAWNGQLGAAGTVSVSVSGYAGI